MRPAPKKFPSYTTKPPSVKGQRIPRKSLQTPVSKKEIKRKPTAASRRKAEQQAKRSPTTGVKNTKSELLDKWIKEMEKITVPTTTVSLIPVPLEPADEAEIKTVLSNYNNVIPDQLGKQKGKEK